MASAFDALTGNRLCEERLSFKIRQTRATRLMNAQVSYLKNCTEQGFLDHIVGVEIPMLVIIGEHDMEPFTSETAAEIFLKWFPNSEMVICNNAAHYPQQGGICLFCNCVQSVSM